MRWRWEEKDGRWVLYSSSRPVSLRVFCKKELLVFQVEG